MNGENFEKKVEKLKPEKRNNGMDERISFIVIVMFLEFL
jgi:hypothetical protein